MSDQEQDKSQKTEEPSHRKLEKAREEGQVFTSREVSTFVSFITAVMAIKWLFPALAGIFHQQLLRTLLAAALPTGDNRQLLAVITELLCDLALPTLALILPFTVMGIAASLLQHGIVYSPKALQPKLDRISIAKGWKRLFSLNALIEMGKGLAKITVVGWALYATIKPELNSIFSIKDFTAVDVLQLIRICVVKMLFSIVVIMFFLAAADYLYQRHRYYGDMRMTKQEVKDEHKQMEGNPQIKGKMRSLARSRARRNLGKVISEATVLVTNPTHYAVAIKYDAESMAAPMVTAKGIDEVALEMRQLAREQQVPVVENQTLARALYADVKVDQEITESYYQTVANLINYVYRLNRQRRR